MASSRRPRIAASKQAGSALMLAQAVVALRLPLMGAEATRPGAKPVESIRATTEKIAAATEGALAAQLSLAKSMWSFWPDLASGRLPGLVSGKALREASDAAMKPAERRVRANFRRLSQR